MNIKDLENYAKQTHYYLGSLADTTKNMSNIHNTLNEFIKRNDEMLFAAIANINNKLDEVIHQLEKTGLIKFDTYEMQITAIKNQLALDWPLAVQPDKIDFAKNFPEAWSQMMFNNLIHEYIQDKKFLDFGCKQGHFVQIANKMGASLSVGYDLKHDWEFANSDKCHYTSNIEELKSYGTFDIILLNDVLDHVDDPIFVLSLIRELISDKGRVYVRCHPWCSRSGGHLHNDYNKAYLHLIMDEVELKRLSYACRKTQKVFHPLQVYPKWFEQTDFDIAYESTIEDEPEDFFFKDPVIVDRLQRHWKSDNVKSYMSITYVDYILEPRGQKVF